MLTPAQIQHLAAYTCPSCGKALGRFHCYPVTPAVLISRLAESAPMHQECARAAAPLLLEMVGTTKGTPPWGASSEGSAPVPIAIIYTVKSSSPTAPSGRLFQRTPGDSCVHLHSPDHIDFFAPSRDVGGDPRRATYSEIQEAMLPAVKQASDAAQTQDEFQAITRQIAALHRYLPPIPK